MKRMILSIVVLVGLIGCQMAETAMYNIPVTDIQQAEIEIVETPEETLERLEVILNDSTSQWGHIDYYGLLCEIAETENMNELELLRWLILEYGKVEM